MCSRCKKKIIIIKREKTEKKNGVRIRRPVRGSKGKMGRKKKEPSLISSEQTRAIIFVYILLMGVAAIKHDLLQWSQGRARTQKSADCARKYYFFVIKRRFIIIIIICLSLLFVINTRCFYAVKCACEQSARRFHLRYKYEKNDPITSTIDVLSL